VSAHLRRQEAAWLAAEAARTGTTPNPGPGQTASGGPVVETGPVAEEAESLPGARARGRVRRPAPLLVVAAVVLPAAIAALVGMRGLLGGVGTASSSVLLPAPAAGADLWRAAMSSWRAVGLGAAAVADPLAAVLAALAAPLGSPRTAVTVLLVAAVP